MNLSTTLQDVQDAAARLVGHIHTTPLLESALLNETLGFRLLVKAESLQVTGSFKTRGAFNQLLQLTPGEKAKGVVAFSSGNHAQGVAYAAKKLGVAAAILMPDDAPRLKKDNTLAYGAEIRTYRRATEERDIVGNRLVEERGAKLVHSYNDPRTIAGQGTAGLEIFRQTETRQAIPDALIVNCCGGGLAAGIALTRDLYAKPPAFYTAEPEGFNDAQRSLAAGAFVVNEKKSGSVCDALLMDIGSLTLPILLHHEAKGLTASDEDALAAMNIAAEHFGLVLEPSGAVALAAACLNCDEFRGLTVVAVVTGRNIGADDYAALLQRGRPRAAQMLPALAV